MKRTTRIVLAIFGLVVLVGIVIYLNRRGVLPDLVAIPIQLALTICAGLLGVRGNRPDH